MVVPLTRKLLYLMKWIGVVTRLDFSKTTPHHKAVTAVVKELVRTALNEY